MLCQGSWHTLGHHVPKLFAEIKDQKTRLDELYASTKQMVCPRCSVQMDYPADHTPAGNCFACSRLRAAVRAEAEARGRNDNG